MNLSNFFYSLLLLIVPYLSIGQTKEQLLVPYRVGDLFGLADYYSGELVYPAEFDFIDINKFQSKSDYFFGVKNDSASVIYKGKKFISKSGCTDFFILENYFIIGERNHLKIRNINSNLTQDFYTIFNIKGEKITPYNVKDIKAIGLSEIPMQEFKNIPLVLEDFNNKNNLVIFNKDAQNFSKTLLSNCYSIEASFEGDYVEDKIYYTVIKQKDVKPIKYVLVLNGNSFTFQPFAPSKKKVNTSLVIDTPENEPERMYTIEGDDSPPNIDSDMMFPPAIEAPVGVITTKNRENKSFQKKEYFFNQSCKNDTLIITKILYLDNHLASSEQIKKPLRSDEIQIRMQGIRYTDSKNVTLGTKSVLIYKKNNKYGYVITDSIYSDPIYESITLINQGHIYSGNSIFLYVGLVDPISNKIYYGTIDPSGKVSIPIKYDSFLNTSNFINLDRKDEFTIYTRYKYWIVSKDNKYGLVDHIGNLKEDLIFEDIFRMNERDATAVLKLNGKYGLLIESNKYDSSVWPSFTKIPGKIIKDYLGNEGENLIELYETRDEEDGYSNFICYGNKNGRMFYSEK